MSKGNTKAYTKKYIEDRLGHDRRYILDITKIRTELGWEPKIDFEKGMDDLVEWYKKNKAWWSPLLGKGFVENYKEVNNFVFANRKKNTFKNVGKCC